jgi:NAD+ kinase
MKRVGLLARPDFTVGINNAKQILAYLESQKIRVFLLPHIADALDRSELACSPEKMKVDFVITLGGDGTTLYAARHLPPDVPILPVNLESFGFLSECEIHEVEELLDQVLAGKLSIQETPRLAVWFKKKRLPDAANEVALFPEDPGRPVPITVKLQDITKFSFRADGFLVSTPMGSTGHSFSLGGPILDLRLPIFLLMAIAPLRQGFYPLVVPSDSTIHIELEKLANCFIDGNHIVKVASHTPILVKKSEHPLRILRRQRRFYTRLQDKLLRC